MSTEDLTPLLNKMHEMYKDDPDYLRSQLELADESCEILLKQLIALQDRLGIERTDDDGWALCEEGCGEPAQSIGEDGRYVCHECGGGEDEARELPCL